MNELRKFFEFETMVTLSLAKTGFALGVAVLTIIAIVAAINFCNPLLAFAEWVLACVTLRISCEYLIVLFSIHQCLTSRLPDARGQVAAEIDEPAPQPTPGLKVFGSK